MAQIKAKRDLERAQRREDRISSLFNFTSSSESSSKEDEKADSSGLGQELKSKWRKLRGKHASSTSTSTPPTPNTPVTSLSPPASTTISADMSKPKMSFRLVSLLVYTVGVKCHGVGPNSPVSYSPEHMFSLSENAINRLMKSSGVLHELIKHTQKNLVRIYPKGMRVNSTNYEPHRYWAAGAQVVAINWQTFGKPATFNAL